MPKYLTKEQLGDYSVKSVKTFVGREGYGFNCSLYRLGKKIGFCRDMASGVGMYPIDWAKNVDARAEQILLNDHVKGLPKVPSGLENMSPLDMDEGWLVDELINQFEEDKAERKQRKDCLTKTLYTLKDGRENSLWIMKAAYTPAVKARLETEYGDNLKEIINERYVVSA